MALVPCPNCKTLVTEVSARCFSCGYPMPKRYVPPAAKKRTSITRAYLAGGGLVVAGWGMRTLGWIGRGFEEALIVIGLLVFVGSILARILMNWVDKPMEP